MICCTFVFVTYSIVIYWNWKNQNQKSKIENQTKDLPMKPPIMPRTLLSASNNRTSIANANSSSNANGASTTTTTTTMTTTTTVLNQSNQTRSKIISTSSTNTETQETLSKTIISEQGSSSTTSSSSNRNKSTEQAAMACASLINNEILSIRNGHLQSGLGSGSAGKTASSCGESNVKRIAGKEISTLFEVWSKSTGIIIEPQAGLIIRHHAKILGLMFSVCSLHFGASSISAYMSVSIVNVNELRSILFLFCFVFCIVHVPYCM